MTIQELKEKKHRLEEEIAEKIRKFEKAKQLFKEQGLYKGDFSNFEDELFSDLMFAQHIGYVEVELLPNVKITDRHFKVKDNRKLKGLSFCEQTIYYNEDKEDEYDTYLVCQWCNFEDDYKGYILLPMKDGKYWCFYYEM